MISQNSGHVYKLMIPNSNSENNWANQRLYNVD